MALRVASFATLFAVASAISIAVHPEIVAYSAEHVAAAKEVSRVAALLAPSAIKTVSGEISIPVPRSYGFVPVSEPIDEYDNSYQNVWNRAQGDLRQNYLDTKRNLGYSADEKNEFRPVVYKNVARSVEEYAKDFAPQGYLNLLPIVDNVATAPVDYFPPLYTGPITELLNNAVDAPAKKEVSYINFSPLDSPKNDDFRESIIASEDVPRVESIYTSNPEKTEIFYSYQL